MKHGSILIVSALLCANLLLTACSNTARAPGDLAEKTDRHLSDIQQQEARRATRRAKAGDHSGALNILERLVEQQPHHPELWSNLATLYYQMGKPDALDQALARVQQLDPNNAQALNLAGILALDNHEPEAAQQLFAQSLEAHPNNPDAHYNLALIYDTYYQDLRRAIQHYQAYLQSLNEPDEATESWLKQLESAFERQQQGQAG